MLNDLPTEPIYKELQIKIADGDLRAFRLLFDSLFLKLSKFSFSFVLSKEISVEIVDELFVQLWLKKEEINNINDIKVYLYTATKNASLNYLTKRARTITMEPYENVQVQISDDSSPEQILITKELQNKISSAVNSLPPRCKLIFKLIREDGLKYKEVAEILNLSIKTVDNQMIIAVSKIRESIQNAVELKNRSNFQKK